MRALTIGAVGSLEYLRVEDLPAPRMRGADDVLVRLRAAALNRLDLFVLEGLPGPAPSFPHVVGSDGAGIVETSGPGVTRFRPGDRVMINPGISCGACEWCLRGEQSLCGTFHILGEHVPGTAAELVVVPERNLAAVPSGMSWPQAAGFSLATLTAWRMLAHRAAVRGGETVLVWGIGGGVSLASIRIASLLGARVIATSSSDAKLEVATTLGAEAVLNHAKVDVPREVRRLTGGRGADVVVDNVGQQTWERSLRCLARLGRLVVCGATSGPMCTTDIRKLFWHQWTILGSTMGSHDEYREVTALAGRGLLWPTIDTIVPLEEGQRAFERLRSGAQTGKIIIEVPE
jgi:NADPH:quinone reductase-like Zn-dependent oxidoreductase